MLDLLKAGKSVAQVAFDLDVSDQSIYDSREQELIDSGLRAGRISTWASTRTTTASSARIPCQLLAGVR